MDNREIVSKIESGRVINVRVDVAEEIGLNEAIVLGQISYWLERSSNRRDGMVWVYKTYDDWTKEFKWWSKATIRRAIKSLEDSGLIVSTSEYNRMRQDATKWYTVPEHSVNKGMSSPCAQNEQPELQNEQPMAAQNEHTVNHRVPESTSENTLGHKILNSNPWDDKDEDAELRDKVFNLINDNYVTAFSNLRGNSNGTALDDKLRPYIAMAEQYGFEEFVRAFMRAKDDEYRDAMKPGSVEHFINAKGNSTNGQSEPVDMMEVSEAITWIRQ